MKKVIFFAIIIVLAVLAVAAVWQRGQNLPNKTGKISVVTTLFPLYDFAKNIGGDKTDVFLLLPPGMEPHSFEPTPSDLVRVNQARIFIYTGKFMEPWAEDVIKSISGNEITVVDSSVDIALTPGVFHDADELVGSMDPHIWLDFDNDKVIIDNLLRGLVVSDPTNADYYIQRAARYKDTLSALDLTYKTELSACQGKEIIYGGHYAFGYLASRYGLRYSAAQGISPDAEPTAHDLMRLVDQIRKENIKYIFYEELTSPKISQTIADETQAKMLILNAAHNVSKEDYQNNVSFLAIMEENLENLKIGLQCR